MPDMTIGEVARRAGLRTSTLRYYEEIGLLPVAPRRGGQRRYDTGILQRLAVIHTAQQAGFTLAEVAILVNDILPSPSPGPQWRDLLERKLREVNTLLAQIERMRGLLLDVMGCDDPELADCIFETGQRHAISEPDASAHPLSGYFKSSGE